ncbi:hypothetical protein PanWU01x14_141500 [Parasponia andersonii]|uniref:Uncharacterized protein n=1 Tax=Parasponia andersonii TaxID=3476 RepID=A0A2P5CLM5_PARAD|nr:hypothetical protein PanWU01x14_141500 [Parasponia andersonii]
MALVDTLVMREEHHYGISKEKHKDHKAAPISSVREERYHGIPKEKYEDPKATLMSNIKEEYYYGRKKHDDHKAPRVDNHRKMLKYFKNEYDKLSPNRYVQHQPQFTHYYPQSHVGHKEPYYVVPNKGPHMEASTTQYHPGDQNYPQVGWQVRKKQGGAVDSNIDEAAKLLPGEVFTDFGRRYKFPVNFNDRKNEVPIEFVYD